MAWKILITSGFQQGQTETQLYKEGPSEWGIFAITQAERKAIDKCCIESSTLYNSRWGYFIVVAL